MTINIRTLLERHWAASDASDFETEHEIYHNDAILDYPQSGEQIRGRQEIQFSRAAQPNKKRFSVKRILGIDDLWITELVITYDGQPSYVVSIMQFHGAQVAHETQYFGDPFEPGLSRSQWVERMGEGAAGRTIGAANRNQQSGVDPQTVEPSGGLREDRRSATESTG